ncbi:uncharacterized protein [Porites lutea]|uniref:uncharacterized protein isoform X3 n=1 Tax=Porites lutea TaxID=51062 RepID=UPI003CC63C80
MKVLFQGIPTGLELAKEFKGSTTKKIYMHWKSSSGVTATTSNPTSNPTTATPLVTISSTSTTTSSSSTTSTPIPSSRTTSTAISSSRTTSTTTSLPRTTSTTTSLPRTTSTTTSLPRTTSTTTATSTPLSTATTPPRTATTCISSTTSLTGTTSFLTSSIGVTSSLNSSAAATRTSSSTSSTGSMSTLTSSTTSSSHSFLPAFTSSTTSSSSNIPSTAMPSPAFSIHTGLGSSSARATPTSATASITVTATPLSVPRDGLSTRRLLARLAGQNNANDDISLSPPEDDDLVVLDHSPTHYSSTRASMTQGVQPLGGDSNTRSASTVQSVTAQPRRTGFFQGTPFNGPGIQAGTVKQDLFPFGLGVQSIFLVIGPTRRRTSRSDEVANCQCLLQSSSDQTCMLPFLNHSFEELCWQANEDCKGVIVTLVNKRKTIDEKRRDLLRVLHEMEFKHSDNWLFWIGETSSTDGLKVMDIYGGDPRTERMLFLVPSVGRSPSLLGQISDADIDEVGSVLKKVLERVAVHQQQRKKWAISSSIQAQQVRQMRRQRITRPPKEGYKVIVRDLVQGRPLMSRKFSETAFYQEVYDWAGGADEMPLFFTLHKESRPTCISHKERLKGHEVLSFVERDEEDMVRLLGPFEVEFRGNIPCGTSEEDLSKTVQDASPTSKPPAACVMSPKVKTTTTTHITTSTTSTKTISSATKSRNTTSSTAASVVTSSTTLPSAITSATTPPSTNIKTADTSTTPSTTPTSLTVPLHADDASPTSKPPAACLTSPKVKTTTTTHITTSTTSTKTISSTTKSTNTTSSTAASVVTSSITLSSTITTSTASPNMNIKTAATPSTIPTSLTVPLHAEEEDSNRKGEKRKKRKDPRSRKDRRQKKKKADAQ